MSKRLVNSPLYSITDGARYLHTDANLVREAIKLGYLPVFDFGSPKLYRPAMDEFIVKYMGMGNGKKLEHLVRSGKAANEKLVDGERRIVI